MIQIYVKEFIGIGLYLKKNGKIHKGYILIDKPELEIMLNKNKYDSAANKLKIWKTLKWIDTEADQRLTKRVYVGEGKYKPFVKIDLSILNQLEKLQKSS